MAQATDTTRELTDGQKAWLAVGIAKQHDLPMTIAVRYADTVAALLPTLPPDTTRRCHCGERIGHTEQWCSTACFRADEDEHELELEDVG